MNFLYFVIMVGVLVFVHEFGHFIVAKFFDVKVIRFSIGFGPRLFGFHKGETEYVIGALPLGGYVQMLGHDFADLEDVSKEDMERALMAKPIWQRSLIILAGPLANILLPIVIYFIVGLTHTTAPPALIGEVFEGSPAAQGQLQPGDQIVAIDGNDIGYWHELIDHVSPAYGKPLKFTYLRDGKRHTTTITPEKKTSTDFLGLNQRTYGMMGVHLGTYGTTIALKGPEVPGAKQGLKHFDRVVAIDGKQVRRFDEVASKIRTSGGKTMTFAILRPNAVQKSFGRFYGLKPQVIKVTPQAEGKSFTLGLVRGEMVVSRIKDNSPAQKAGLAIGDRVISMDDKPYNSWSLMVSRMHNRINEKIVKRKKDDKAPIKMDFVIKYVRNGQTLTTTLTPEVKKFEGQAKTESYRIFMGWGHISHTIMPDEVAFPIGARIAYAARTSIDETMDYIKMMFMGLVRMAQGRVGCDSVGGPILIGELAAQAGEAGIKPFLRMMALISINLAIFNLVPIPVLDGGQLTLFAIEAIKRGPLSFRTRQIAAYIGFALIIMIMVLAFKNDIERNWDRIVDYISAE